MYPRKSGLGLFPRYGGGWMHQFGHVYALQQELLDPNANNWFRATELWHLARHEGVAMNSSHFTNILRQCVEPGAWEQALRFLHQMKRENLRPDVVGVGSILAACAEAKKRAEVEEVFRAFASTMLLDSVCYLALIRARMEAGDAAAALEAGKMQAAHSIPFVPSTFCYLLEASELVDDVAYAFELTRRMDSEQWWPNNRACAAVRRLATRHADQDGDGVHSLRDWLEAHEEPRALNAPQASLLQSPAGGMSSAPDATGSTACERGDGMKA